MDIIKTFYFISILLGSSLGTADTEAVNYIEQHKELAVIEMYRSGVPASITMAQALHESNSGNSKLAKKANNHFGIKCKSYWEGKVYFHQDDDFDSAGNLVDSCFRAYENVFDSYIDHSHFLSHTSHYQWLFDLDPKNYKAWAEGLQKSGYATDKKYAQKLISYIEKFNLSELDEAVNPFDLLNQID